jgi:hypothetical protein
MKQTKIILDNGISFTIVHDMPEKGNINTLYAAIDCWFARTDNLSGASFCAYVMDKFNMGISPYRAYEITENKRKP